MKIPISWYIEWAIPLDSFVIFNDEAILITKRKNEELYSMVATSNKEDLSFSTPNNKNLNIILDEAIKVQRCFFERDKAKRISAIMKLTAMKGK